MATGAIAITKVLTARLLLKEVTINTLIMQFTKVHKIDITFSHC